MSERIVQGINHAIKGKNFTGNELSWIGDCLWTNAISFGTESGEFITHTRPDKLFSIQVASDSINGVAFNGEYAVFTSRNSVLLARRSPPDSISIDPVSIWYEGGAHGVIASSFGGFIAPIGPSGVLLFSLMEDKQSFDVRIAQHGKSPLNAYKLVLAGRNDKEHEVVAFAAREQGIVAFEYAGKNTVTGAVEHLFNNQDLVSLCALKHPKLPRGVAALSRDCKIILIPDVMQLSDVVTLDYPELMGTGYELIAAQGHLFVLTSKSFVTLENVVEEFATQRFRGRRQTATFIPTQGISIYPAGESGIYLIEEEGAIEFPISELAGASIDLGIGFQTLRVNLKDLKNIKTDFKDIERKVSVAKGSTEKTTLELAAA